MPNLKKPLIIGAVHLPQYGRANPRPGVSMAELEDYVLANCSVFVQNGLDTLYLQDENLSAGRALEETTAVVSALGRLAKREIPALKLGIIIEAHDGIAPIAIAHACGADFVRLKVFAGAMLKAPGLQQGCGIEAVQYRAAIGAEVAIFADAHDRTGYPLAGVPIQAVTDWVSRTGADAVILTGMTYAQSLEYLDIGRKTVKGKPIILGGGVTIDNIAEVLRHADGAVVSSSLMLDRDVKGSPVHWDAGKIRRFMEAVAACGPIES